MCHILYQQCASYLFLMGNSSNYKLQSNSPKAVFSSPTSRVKGGLEIPCKSMFSGEARLINEVKHAQMTLSTSSPRRSPWSTHTFHRWPQVNDIRINFHPQKFPAIRYLHEPGN